MSKASYYGSSSGGFFVTEKLEGCHPRHKDYPLLEGDWLFKRDDGTYYKHGPGLGISGFILTPEQEATLRANDKEVVYGMGGMDYFMGGEDES